MRFNRTFTAFLTTTASLSRKDTTLAWLMPTNTAMHLITLAHSLLNLCGSPKWLSRQGYSRPTTAVEQTDGKTLKLATDIRALVPKQEYGLEKGYHDSARYLKMVSVKLSMHEQQEAKGSNKRLN